MFYQRFIKLLWPKIINKIKYSSCLCILALCEAMPSTLIQAVYNLALTFTWCSCGAWRSTRDESWGFSQVFSQHAFNSAHVCILLDYPVCTGIYKSLYSPIYLFSQLLPSQTFLDVCHLFRLLPIARRSSANAATQGTTSVPGMLTITLSKAKPFHQSSGNQQTDWNHYHNYVRIRTILLPLALVIWTRSVKCYIHGHS